MSGVMNDTHRMALMPRMIQLLPRMIGGCVVVLLFVLLISSPCVGQRPFPGGTAAASETTSSTTPNPFAKTAANPPAGRTTLSTSSPAAQPLPNPRATLEPTIPAQPTTPTQTQPTAAPSRSVIRNSPIRPVAGERQMPTRSSRMQDSEIHPAEFSVEKLIDEPLVDIKVEGNSTILPNAILRYIETRPGRAPSTRLIQQDVARLLNTRWFIDVKPFYRQTEAGPVLVFEVIERPMLQRVRFIGNKKIKTPELEAHTGLRPGHGFDISANRESVERIKALYRERGYRFAQVTLEKGDKQTDREVVFRIVEGSKVKIWGIQFSGNKEITAPVLKTKLDSKTVILWVIRGDYDPDIIRNDVLALKQYYMQLGYFDIEADYVEKFSPDKSKVYLTYNIKEGKRYKIGNIELAGNEILGRHQLLSTVELPPGKFFNARHLRKDVTAMKEQYDELGHMFAKVDPVPKFRKDEPGIVDLVYNIDEDEPRYWGQINIHIRGDYPHTREEIVRQQINRYIVPGTLASGSDYRMAQARIRGSNLWERSDPATFAISPTDGGIYMPTLVARGQSRDNLTPTSARQQRVPERRFGHSIGSRSVHKPTELSSKRTEVQPSTTQSQQGSTQSGRVTMPPSDRRQTSSKYQFADPTPSNSVGHSIATMEPTKLGSLSSKNISKKRFNPGVIFRGQSPEPIVPQPILIAANPGLPAQPMYRGQSLDQYGNPVPQNYMNGVSPQGDPYGDALTRPSSPGFVDVNIDVTEGRTGRLMFGVGVNSDAGVVGSLTLQEDNFDIMRPPRSWADIVNGRAWRGGGQSFRVEAVPGSDVSRYLVSWQDPYFLRSDFSLGVSGFYYNRFYRDWTEDRLGGRVSLGYVLNKYWSVSSALRLESVKMRSFDATNPATPQDLVDVKGSNFLSTAALTLSYDTRDSSFTPTQGGNVDLTYEQGFGEFTYPRFDLSGGKYFTLFERPDGFGKHVLAVTGQAGWTGSGTPIFERYYAGGYSSFRGFAFRGITPRENGFRVGGEFMTTGSVEYMVPLTADDNIRAVVFSDFGTVEPEAGLDAFRASAGFGVRLVIPAMGPAPLAFDFAWPITKQDEDDTRVFSFYVGFTR